MENEMVVLILSIAVVCEIGTAFVFYKIGRLIEKIKQQKLVVR